MLRRRVACALFAVFVVALAFLCGCARGGSGGDDDPPAGDDDDATTCTVTGVTVSETAGNPLARELAVTTDAPCLLAANVTGAGLAGSGTFAEESSEPGTEHRLLLLGLAEAEVIEVAIQETESEATTLYTESLWIDPLPDWAPRPIAMEDDGSTDRNTWVALTIPKAMVDRPDLAGLLLIVDRDGRLRFFYEIPSTAPLTFPPLMSLMRLSGGDFVYGNEVEFLRVTPAGESAALFDLQLDDPVLLAQHHIAHIEPDASGALVLLNRMGDGVACDKVTPTDRVVGDVVAEVDAAGREVRRWDAFAHTDAVPLDAFSTDLCEGYLYGPRNTDWTHGNAVHATDGGDAFLLSLRNVDRVLKIDRETGEVVWQMGRGLDFEWVGDEPEEARWFSHPHDPQFIDADRLLVFDNHNGRGTDWSRGLELAVDFQAMTVRAVWESRVPFTDAMGNLTRLEDGHTLISVGMRTQIVEADEAGSIVWRAQFEEGLNQPAIYQAIPIPAYWTE